MQFSENKCRSRSSLRFSPIRSSAKKRGKAANLLALLLLTSIGCGTTRTYTATEQLLLSDAVDSTVTKIDFRPLSGQRVFLETKYSDDAGKSKQTGATNAALVNSDYVISAVRQQLMAAGCLMVDKREECDLIVEMRLGALGGDAHSVVYGIPAFNLGGAGTLIPGGTAIPAIPELALAKKEQKTAAAKVALFAYNRQTMEPFWQSGIAQAGANAKDQWVMGVGPFQSGSIYAGTRFAGRRMHGTGLPNAVAKENEWDEPTNGVDHRGQFVFERHARSDMPDPNSIPAAASAEQYQQVGTGGQATPSKLP